MVGVQQTIEYIIGRNRPIPGPSSEACSAVPFSCVCMLAGFKEHMFLSECQCWSLKELENCTQVPYINHYIVFKNSSTLKHVPRLHVITLLISCLLSMLH